MTSPCPSSFSTPCTPATNVEENESSSDNIAWCDDAFLSPISEAVSTPVRRKKTKTSTSTSSSESSPTSSLKSNHSYHLRSTETDEPLVELTPVKKSASPKRSRSLSTTSNSTMLSAALSANTSPKNNLFLFLYMLIGVLIYLGGLYFSIEVLRIVHGPSISR